jgi:hypothetical protein
MPTTRTPDKLRAPGQELGIYLRRACPECGCFDRVSLYWFQDARPESEWLEDPNLTCHNCFAVFRESEAIKTGRMW